MAVTWTPEESNLTLVPVYKHQALRPINISAVDDLLLPIISYNVVGDIPFSVDVDGEGITISATSEQLIQLFDKFYCKYSIGSFVESSFVTNNIQNIPNNINLIEYHSDPTISHTYSFVAQATTDVETYEQEYSITINNSWDGDVVAINWIMNNKDTSDE